MADMEPEDVDEIAIKLQRIANAISADAAPGHDAAGGTVNSLTEAVMGVTAGLFRVAEAIDGIASAIKDRK